MKHFYTLLLVFLSGYCTQAQVTVSKDTARKNGGHEVFTSVETVPEFPGGAQAFGNYLGKNLRYPEVARLIVFSIKDTLYTIDEAEKILGKSFSSNQVKAAEPFYNYDKLPKYDMPDKKEVYLIIMKSS